MALMAKCLNVLHTLILKKISLTTQQLSSVHFCLTVLIQFSDWTYVTCQQKQHPPSAVDIDHLANRCESSCLTPVVIHSMHEPGD